MNNSEFMQQMLRKAANRRRAEWGLQPLPTTSEPITRAERPAVAPGGDVEERLWQNKGNWFGQGCHYQCCQWEETVETGGPDYREADPSLIFCKHIQNKDNFEGNCNEQLCPRVLNSCPGGDVEDE